MTSGHHMSDAAPSPGDGPSALSARADQSSLATPQSYATRKSARAHLASCLGELPSAPLIAGDPPTGVPVALVPAPNADGDHDLVPESARPNPGARDDIARRKQRGVRDHQSGRAAVGRQDQRGVFRQVGYSSKIALSAADSEDPGEPSTPFTHARI